MVGTGTGIMNVDLVGTSYFLVTIFSIRSCFAIRFTFPSGYTGSKVGDATYGYTGSKVGDVTCDVTVAESTAEPRDCVGCLVGAGSLAESSRRCGGLVVLLSAGSPRRLAPAFIHSPYRLGCCSGLGSCKVQFFFSWPK